jgi:hypothetical protein
VNSITSIAQAGLFTTTPGRSESPVERERGTPMTAAEIAAVICELAGIGKMGVDDDFFRATPSVSK